MNELHGSSNASNQLNIEPKWTHITEYFAQLSDTYINEKLGDKMYSIGVMMF